MAGPLTRFVSEALLEAALDAQGRFGERTRRAIDWLREAARPPEGVELRSDDGSLYTGIVIVNENLPVAALVVRHGPGARRLRTPTFVSRVADHDDFDDMFRDETPFGR